MNFCAIVTLNPDGTRGFCEPDRNKEGKGRLVYHIMGVTTSG